MAAKPKDAAATEEEQERAETRRMVLKRETVLVLPEGVDLAAIAAAKDERELRKLVSPGDPRGAAPTVGWVPQGQYAGSSKTKAIESHAGKPGTDSAKVGAFKAVGLSAWSGGVIYRAPPKPLVERTELDD